MTQKNNNTILLSFYLNDELFETIYTKKKKKILPSNPNQITENVINSFAA